MVILCNYFVSTPGRLSMDQREMATVKVEVDAEGIAWVIFNGRRNGMR
jgi:hypothetical protein